MKLHPFRALHPPSHLAGDVASPPYDVVSTEEARAIGDARPRSFLHVVRPEIDLDPAADIHGDAVYAAGAATLRRFAAEGTLTRDTEPAIWLYRLDMGEHSQVGFVGCAEVEDYQAGLIKRHEFTRPDKEDDRTRHVDTLGAHTGPVFLTCPESASLATTQSRLTEGPPTLDVTADGGVRHRLWRVTDEASLSEIASGFGALPAFYIADGHHRAASAWRVRDLRRQRAEAGEGDGAWDRFLVVVFPEDQLKILAYNR
ncbi:MAG: DUF1015 domain-containing protein, partial [Myxococcota bacterium]|nr:DUF1015 domain-containing protein [Myxococcota bacterium]